MELSTWVILFVAAYLAMVVGTVTGFGSATLLLPVAASFMDIKIAVAVVAVYHLTANAARVLSYAQATHWRVVLLFGFPSIVSAIIGAQMTLGLPSRLLELILGFFLIGYVVYSFWKRHNIRMSDRLPVLVGGGVLSGILSGLLGTGGPVRALYLLGLRMPKEAYLGTSAVIALIVDIGRLPVYVQGGLVPMSALPLMGVLVLAACLGIWEGRRLVSKLSALWVTRCILALLAVLGVRFLLKGLGL